MKTKIEEYLEHRRRLKEDPFYAKEVEEKEYKDLIDYWNRLKPFKLETDVPHLPNELTDFFINKLIELGAIPLNKLEVNEWYYGNYRNANIGKWDGKKFKHIRFSFTHYWDECNHFQQDDGFALFVPLRKATKEEIKNELKELRE